MNKKTARELTINEGTNLFIRENEYSEVYDNVISNVSHYRKEDGKLILKDKYSTNVTSKIIVEKLSESTIIIDVFGKYVMYDINKARPISLPFTSYSLTKRGKQECICMSIPIEPFLDADQESDRCLLATMNFQGEYIGPVIDSLYKSKFFLGYPEFFEENNNFFVLDIREAIEILVEEEKYRIENLEDILEDSKVLSFCRKS